jgi:predicted transcriptional regulator
MTYDLYSGTPPHSNPTTSREAAEAIRPSAVTLRRIVLAYIKAEPGCTDEQIQFDLGMDGNTQRPRRRELELEGKIKSVGTTKNTRSGRAAKMWAVA